MNPIQKHGVEIAVSALTALVVVSAIVFLPFPRSGQPARLPSNAVDEQTDYSLDSVTIGNSTVVLRWHPQPNVAFLRGREIAFTGWAVDRARRSTVSSVVAVIDGGATFPARMGIDRADVAATLGNPHFAVSGFRLTIPPCSLDAGRHRIAFRFGASDGRGFFRSRDDVDVDVLAAGSSPRDVAYAVDTIQPALSIPGRHTLAGWMVDTAGCDTARALRVSIDGRTVTWAVTGRPRPDVATALGSPAYAGSGFVATWTDATLAPGRHVLRLAASFVSGREVASGFARSFVR